MVEAYPPRMKIRYLLGRLLHNGWGVSPQNWDQIFEHWVPVALSWDISLRNWDQVFWCLIKWGWMLRWDPLTENKHFKVYKSFTRVQMYFPTYLKNWQIILKSTMHNGGARGHFNFSQFWDLLTWCINFYSHSLIFPAILPPLIIYNLFIWWYRWVSGEEYYHFLYFAFSVAQTVQKLQVFCFFWSVNGFRESHKTLQQ